jgi:cytochrome c
VKLTKLGILNLLLAATLGGLLALFLLLHTDTKHRNQYLLRGMDVSPASQDFAENPNFANGQTLQLPPVGTVPQGYEPYHFDGGPDGSLKAGAVLKSPLDPDDATVLERGKLVYERDCLPCHGSEARGDGPVSMVRRDGGFPGVASLLSAHAKEIKDGYIYNYISRGGALMPSYGAQVAPADRWKVVAYVRHLQKTLPENAPAAEATPDASAPAASAPPTEAPAPAAPAAAPAAAAAASGASTEGGDWNTALALIQKSDCLTCHSVNKKVVGPAYKDVAKKYAGKPEAVAALVKKVKLGGAGNWGQIPMVAHPGISDADLETIVKGILSLAKGHAMAKHSLKEVMAMVHSGVPVRCPAVNAGVGPAYLALADRSEGAEVSRVRAIDPSREAQP